MDHRCLAAAAFASALLATPMFAQGPERQVQCRLVVAGQSYIDEKCLFRPIGDDGSFQIMAGNGKYFAQVNVDSPAVGQGYWNEEPYANHAHTTLGTVRQEGACWVNDQTSICAY